jgi:beta-glucosidase
LARRAAAAGTVLLTNDGILPLSPSQSVALIGAFAESPRYQGGGSSRVTPTRLSTTLDAFRTNGNLIGYARGYDPVSAAGNPVLIAEAVGLAAKADVAVVLVGLPERWESEGFDRDRLDLPAQHDQLVAAVADANPRTVVALSNGAPVLMPWLDRVGAVIESYLGGQAGGGALVDVLYGVAEPGGRLAETFPRAQGDVSSDPYFPGQPRQVEYREGVFVGYRADGPAPLFPFGHGLSYTTTRWTDAAVDRREIRPAEGVTVSVTVANTGSRTGTDVVQIYVSDRTGVVRRPARQLAGFNKVRLAPGEAITVRIPIAARAFAFWDIACGDWRTPAGEFVIEVARSSADMVHALPIMVRDGVTSGLEPAALRTSLPAPVPTFSRHSTLGEVRATVAGRLLRWFVRRAALVHAAGSDATAMAMIERSLDELPVRTIALFSNGRFGWRAVDVVVDLCNRRPIHALSRLLRRHDA